uniref:C2H2-type domain-containing protein n=1 Tax=Oryza meridionalis TaxID=40149 RepID=A0A0E0DIH0_9ORYZ
MKFVISETCAPEARDVFMDEHSNGHLAKGHDKLAVIKEQTNIEDLIKDEKAEDVELNMIVDEVVLVGNGLAGALLFCMKCSTEAFVTKQASDANASGLSVVEKEHPRSLTPMLWAKKVEHFSEHQTKRPCWEQCLRHLQRDRRTEPAVDLTVWSRFRALTDSNDRARYQRHMTCGENFSDQRYLPMHMLSHEIAEPEPMARKGGGGSVQNMAEGGHPPTEEKEAKARLVDLSGTVGVRREEKGAERLQATGGNVPPCLFGWGLPGRAKLG